MITRKRGEIKLYSSSVDFSSFLLPKHLFLKYSENQTKFKLFHPYFTRDDAVKFTFRWETPFR